MTVTRGCEEITQILLISFIRGLWQLFDVNGVVGTALHSVVCGLQECWEIVFPMFLTMPSQTTIEMAAMLAIIAHKAGYMHHSRTISSQQSKENLRSQFTLESAILDV